MPGTIRKKLEGGKGEPESPAVRLKQENHFVEADDDAMKMMALAEAGARHLARELLLKGEVERPKILVVSKDVFSELVIGYAVELAERLRYEIIAMSVHPAPHSPRDEPRASSAKTRAVFNGRVRKSMDQFQNRASLSGVRCEPMFKSGDLNKAIRDLQHELRRIEFVITGPEVNTEEVVMSLSMPVFSIVS